VKQIQQKFEQRNSGTTKDDYKELLTKSLQLLVMLNDAKTAKTISKQYQLKDK